MCQADGLANLVQFIRQILRLVAPVFAPAPSVADFVFEGLNPLLGYLKLVCQLSAMGAQVVKLPAAQARADVGKCAVVERGRVARCGIS